MVVSVSSKSFLNHIIEINIIKVILNSRKNIFIAAIYRPPDRNLKHDFNISLGNLLQSFPKNISIFIVGDMNIDLLQRDNLANEYCTILQSLSSVPLITKPTRVTGTSHTLLDHIWTNQLHEFNSGTIQMIIFLFF